MVLDNIQEKIDAHIQTALQGKPVAGLALGLFREDDPIFRRGYGLANLEHQVPVTPDTVFSIASITKLFTGTAVFQLIEQGKLNLTDPLGAYLPDLPEAWQSIQIHHLLGLLIEAVSGQTYGDYLQQHIFAPLQMNRTRVNDPYAIVPGRATGYTVEAEQIRHAVYYSPCRSASRDLPGDCRDLSGAVR